MSDAPRDPDLDPCPQQPGGASPTSAAGGQPAEPGDLSPTAALEQQPALPTDCEPAPPTDCEPARVAAAGGAPAPPARDRLIPFSSDPERISPAGWVYPRTWEDRVSAWGKPLIRGVLALIGVAVLVLAGVWAVPSVVVARRPSYALARDRALGDGMLASSLGQGLSCPAVPGFYRLDQEDGDLYEWWVEGPRGRARVRAEVKDGVVRRFRVLQLDLGWLGG